MAGSIEVVLSHSSCYHPVLWYMMEIIALGGAERIAGAAFLDKLSPQGS